MIFHNHKIIFIHIPKTGGSSINKFYGDQRYLDWTKPNYDFLYGWCPDRKIHLQHATPLQLLETGLITHKQWQTYFKFTIVRNPWDRAYSDYLWIMKDQNIKGSFEEYITRTGQFRGILRVNSNKNFRGDHLVPQNDFLGTGKFDKLNYIGKFENLSEEIQLINKKIGLKSGCFDLHEKKNLNKKKHYSYFYNKKKMELVREYFHMDIDQLHYSFIDKRSTFYKIKSWF